jgi:hypothetical protein
MAAAQVLETPELLSSILHYYKNKIMTWTPSSETALLERV